MHRLAPYARPGLAAVLAISLLVVGQLERPAAAEPRGEAHITIEHFMAGLACVESGGRYSAVNPTSGALGKYQIMPRNWKVWAGRFLGDRQAEPNPQNQEVVARSRIERLHASRESWRRVAYWWLTGRSDPRENRWSDKAVGYVEAVMGYARQAASPERAGRVPKRCFPKSFVGVTAAGDPSAGHVMVTGRSVYVRRGPGAENRALAIARRGDVLRVESTDKDPRGKRWIEVRLRGGRTGWISAWYTSAKSDG